MTVPQPERYDKLRIEKLRQLIDNKDYLDQAVYRIAQIMSNEIVHSVAGSSAGSFEARGDRWSGGGSSAGKTAGSFEGDERGPFNE